MPTRPGQTQCETSIITQLNNSNVIEELPVLVERVITLNPNESKIYWFEITKLTEIQKFLVESSVNTVNLAVNIFKSTGANTISIVGGFTVLSTRQESQQDANKGIYYVCIVNLSTVQNTVRITRSNTIFPNVSKLQVNFKAGTRLNSSMESISRINPYQLDNGTFATATMIVSNAPVIFTDCSHPINFFLIDGILPDGISLSINGLLSGIIDCLDCNEVLKDFSPSGTWYGQNAKGEIHAWGRQWRFKVRIELGNKGTIVFDERWFCIRVYKNWSVVHDDLQSKDLNNKDIIIELKEDTVINQFCIPCGEDEIVNEIITKNYNPTQDVKVEVLNQNNCLACDNTNFIIKNIINIPKSIDFVNSNLLLWYTSVEPKTIDEKIFKMRLEESTIFNYLLIKNEIKTGSAPASIISQSIENEELILSMSIIRQDDDIDKQILDIVEKNRHFLSMELHFFVGEFSGID